MHGIRAGHIPLTNPNSISQLLKAARKGHITLPETNRLAVARHRRGKRGHESSAYADNPNLPRQSE